jgi:outer membrane protein
MIKIFLIFISFLFLINNSNAETFSAALKRAYNMNPELNAERESLNISAQELKVSKSSYLPNITLEGSKSQEDTNKLTNRDGTDATITDVDPEVKSIVITQTLLDFGRGAELAKSKIGIELAKAKLLKKEQEILFKAVAAYTGLISAKEKFEINTSNVNLLERQVETDRIRLERGNISLSDVAQSESSLAGARARLIQAENDLLTSKLNYENIIGELNDIESLDKNSIITFKLPMQLNEAIEISKKNNPNLIIAKLEYDQSKKDTISARSDLAPTAKLSFDRSKTNELSSTYDEKEKDVLKATLTWPFYSGGRITKKFIVR